jgi:hypothetical protein
MRYVKNDGLTHLAYVTNTLILNLSKAHHKQRAWKGSAIVSIVTWLRTSHTEGREEEEACQPLTW